MNDMMNRDGVREIAIFTDIHGLLEPLEAILNDAKRRGITEVYSLGDNIGLGPNPYEVISSILQNQVVSVLGNYEEMLIHGPEMFQSYLTKEKIQDGFYTRKCLTKEQLQQIESWPHFLSLHTSHHHLAFVHFANDVRIDFLYHNSYKYMDRVQSGKSGYPQFSYTNSKSQLLYLARKLGMNVMDLKKCYTSDDCLFKIREFLFENREFLMQNPALRGYLSSILQPLFYENNELKTVYDYDYILQGHTHFEVLEKNQNTTFYAIRGAALGFDREDSIEQARYLILTVENEHITFESVEVPYDREKMIHSILHAKKPNQLIRKYTKLPPR